MKIALFHPLKKAIVFYGSKCQKATLKDLVYRQGGDIELFITLVQKVL